MAPPSSSGLRSRADLLEAYHTQLARLIPSDARVEFLDAEGNAATGQLRDPEGLNDRLLQSAVEHGQLVVRLQGQTAMLVDSDNVNLWIADSAVLGTKRGRDSDSETGPARKVVRAEDASEQLQSIKEKLESTESKLRNALMRAKSAEKRITDLQRAKGEAIARAEESAISAALEVRGAQKMARKAEEELKRVGELERRTNEAEGRAKEAEDRAKAFEDRAKDAEARAKTAQANADAAKSRTQAAEQKNAELVHALDEAQGLIEAHRIADAQLRAGWKGADERADNARIEAESKHAKFEERVRQSDVKLKESMDLVAALEAQAAAAVARAVAAESRAAKSDAGLLELEKQIRGLQSRLSDFQRTDTLSSGGSQSNPSLGPVLHQLIEARNIADSFKRKVVLAERKTEKAEEAAATLRTQLQTSDARLVAMRKALRDSEAKLSGYVEELHATRIELCRTTLGMEVDAKEVSALLVRLNETEKRLRDHGTGLGAALNKDDSDRAAVGQSEGPKAIVLMGSVKTARRASAPPKGSQAPSAIGQKKPAIGLAPALNSNAAKESSMVLDKQARGSPVVLLGAS